MEEMTLGTLLAVFEEMFGFWLFWAMVVVAVIVTAGYLYVLVRDRAVSWRKFLWAQLSMPFGAAAAVWFVLRMTDSRLADMGGPIDIIVLMGVAVAGAVGLAILVYTLESLLLRRPARRELPAE
jgi:hypothetical protein